MNILKFTSKEDLEISILLGIDNFLNLASIQREKNFISEGLSGLVTGAKVKHISSNDIEQSIRWKAHFKRMFDNGETINALREFCKKRKMSKKFGTLEGFVYFSIIHHASVFISEAPYSVAFYDPKPLLYDCLKPNTEENNEIFESLNNIQTILGHNQDNNLFIQNPPKKIHISELSIEKRNAYLLYKIAQQIKLNENELFTQDELMFFSTIITKTNNENSQSINDKAIKYKQDLGHCILNFYSYSENIVKGISAYTQKFTENTGKQVPTSSIQNCLNYGKQTVLEKSTHFNTAALSSKIPKSITPKGIAGKVISPEIISAIAIKLINQLVSLSIQSKGYGVINRHGTTGQIRGFLLSFAFTSIIKLIKNQHSYIMELTHEESIKITCNQLENFIHKVLIGYSEAIKTLPNANNKGSLAYYLFLYADPDSNFTLSLERSKEWEREKLSII